MKLAMRVAVFVLGAWLLFFGLRRAHNETMELQNNPATPSSAYSPEILAVGGGFLVLAAFAPSPAVLGRWMSRKRRKPVPHARFRRHHKS